MQEVRLERRDTETQVSKQEITEKDQNNKPSHSLLNSPSIVPRCALLDTSIHIREAWRPLEVLMFKPGWLHRSILSRHIRRNTFLALVSQLPLPRFGTFHRLHRINSLEAATRRPAILEHLSIHHLILADARLERHIDIIYIDSIRPVLTQVLNQPDRMLRRLGNDHGVMIPRTKRIRHSNRPFPTPSSLQSTADSPARQRKQGRGVPAVVRTRHYDIDGAPVLEVVEEADLDAAGRGRVDEDPFIALVVVAWQLADSSVVFMQGPRAEVGRLNRGAD